MHATASSCSRAVTKYVTLHTETYIVGMKLMTKQWLIQQKLQSFLRQQIKKIEYSS